VGKMDVFVQSSDLQISGSRCVPWAWERLNARRTSDEKGTKLFRDQIVNNLANVAVARGKSHYSLVEAMAGADKPVLIQHISEQLRDTVLLRGRTVFGFMGTAIDNIDLAPAKRIP